MTILWPMSRSAIPTFVAVMLISTGCGKTDAVPRSDSSSTADSADSGTSTTSLIVGNWKVTGHHIPGIAAMSDSEATTWSGRTLGFTATSATSGTTRCDAPGYSSRTVDRDHFLASEYHLEPNNLPLLANSTHPMIIEISCGDSAWTFFGSRLIVIDPDHRLAPWDGVFFELQRAPDFVAMGQEPFWRLEIRDGKEIRFTLIGNDDVVTPAPVPEIDSTTGRRLYDATSESHRLHVVVTPERCIDSMNGRAFETSVRVQLDQEVFRGCGGERDGS